MIFHNEPQQWASIRPFFSIPYAMVTSLSWLLYCLSLCALCSAIFHRVRPPCHSSQRHNRQPPDAIRAPMHEEIIEGVLHAGTETAVRVLMATITCTNRFHLLIFPATTGSKHPFIYSFIHSIQVTTKTKLLAEHPFPFIL